MMAEPVFRSKLPSLINRKQEQLRRKITQAEIAEETGVRQATVSQWMNWGEFKRLDAQVVAAFAEYLGVETTELYEFVPGESEAEPVANPAA